MLRALLVALLLLPATAQADEIPPVEQQRKLLDGHRTRLEALLVEQSKRISRLKSQPAGIQRDYQLGAALRESQSLATRLTKLRTQVRELTQKLVQLHDQALRRSGLGAAERAKLMRRRGELVAALTSGPGHIVTVEKASPLDTPDDLDEKADLLQDSEEKLRRQLRQVQTKLASLEQRARLQRHAKAADDNPFVEESPRRSGSARTVVASGTRGTPPAAGPQGDQAESPAAKTPAPPAATAGVDKANSAWSDSDPSYAGGLAGGGAGAPPPAPAEARGSTTETIVSIRDVLDPALLRDPAGVESGEGLRARIAALKKAGERLRQVAGKLSTQASDLRRRAKTLRTQH